MTSSVAVLMWSAEPAYPIGSVDNTLRILLLLRDRGTLTLGDVAEEHGIVRSSAHRLMVMLAYYDFVRQNPVDRSFRIGPALINIGLTAARTLDIRAPARPILGRLAESIGMTAHLVLPRGRTALFVDGVESQRTIRAALRTGTALPAHVCGAGKALLATLTDQQIRQMYARKPPEALTDKSLSSTAALLHEAADIRRTGYAINRGESEVGVLSMGMACVVPAADVSAGLAVAGPEAVEDDTWEERTARHLTEAVTELTKQVQAYNV